ncbi:MAG: dihydroorotase [Eubacteriales bacterium]|nr:dihydroorotase [Eubacteriales bacterium]
MTTAYTGAKVWTGEGFVEVDFTVENGVFAQIGKLSNKADREVSLSGLFVFPGFADVHVHFREPGFSYKETIRTGSLAAAAGGYTAVCTMPNLSPAPDSAETLAAQLSAIEKDACIRVVPYGTITKDRAGRELADLASMAQHVAGFSDDGTGVNDPALLKEAMAEAARLGKVIAAHSEDPALIEQGGCIHKGAFAAEHGYAGISSESEWKPVERDLGLLGQSGCAWHVCHISTKETVEIIRRAKAAGVNVTCETAPHYLVMNDSMLQEDGRFKMNPPIRSEEDRLALVEGLKDGTIDIIATDHAPHSAEEKARGLSGSAMGVVGIETAFPMLYTHLVLPGIVPMQRVLEALTTAPRERFGLGGGVIEEGAEASFTVYDPSIETEVDPASFLSMGRATPFAGWKQTGAIVRTVYQGNEVFTRE